MNTKTKRRMVVVTGIIVVVLIVVLAVVGSGTSAKTVSLAEAASGQYVNQRVQVSGNVVKNSYETNDNVLTFSIYNPDGDSDQQLAVRYDGGVSATFGNDVTAICTGRIDSSGVLQASELVTKCPSKYENATDALDVARLVDYGSEIEGKPVKITGTVKAGSMVAAGKGDRLILVSSDKETEVVILFDGALSEEIGDESALVITGSLQSNGKFEATDVALEG